MSHLLSKRKRPSREDKPEHERTKISGLVLDNATAMTLVHYLNNKVIKSVDYPISTGKEAVVFRATTPQAKFLAVKVFKFETSAFKHMMNYIEGDARFTHVRKRKREMVKEWARKEFSNLKAAFEAGCPVPQPIAQKNNVVFMQFLGEGGVPYALLKDVVMQEPEKIFKQVEEGMRKMFLRGLVHADLSGYNIMLGKDEKGKEKPFFIDVGQSVLLSHPRAKEFLQKDCRNIATLFSENGVEITGKELFETVTKSG